MPDAPPPDFCDINTIVWRIACDVRDPLIDVDGNTWISDQHVLQQKHDTRLIHATSTAMPHVYRMARVGARLSYRVVVTRDADYGITLSMAELDASIVTPRHIRISIADTINNIHLSPVHQPIDVHVRVHTREEYIDVVLDGVNGDALLCGMVVRRIASQRVMAVTSATTNDVDAAVAADEAGDTVSDLSVTHVTHTSSIAPSLPHTPSRVASLPPSGVKLDTSSLPVTLYVGMKQADMHGVWTIVCDVQATQKAGVRHAHVMLRALEAT